MSAVGTSANCPRSDGDARNTEAWLPGIPHILPHGKVYNESILLSTYAKLLESLGIYYTNW